LKHRILIRETMGRSGYYWIAYVQCPSKRMHLLVRVDSGELFGNGGWIAQLLREPVCPYCEKETHA
jgi:hypothetical protein